MKALKVFLIVLILTEAASAGAAPVNYGIKTQDLKFNGSGCDGTCAVGFEIGYSVGTHDGWTREIDGRVVYSADPFLISEAEFNVPSPALTTGKIALRDKHMHEVLESEKFQVISFVLSKPIASDSVAKMNPGDEVKVSATGVWTMHGVSREMTIPMKIKLLKDAGNPLLIRAKFDLNNADFGIKPYTYLGLTTEDTSTISLNLPLHSQ